MAQDIVSATRSYEDWLAGKLSVVAKDLDTKHASMAGDPFRFLRATYYRWAETFPKLCPKVAAAPKLLAVGDLHCENFGTWRDSEGRLAWGVNDFDEAWTLPYTNDLVRLATSLRLAAEDGFGLSPDDACAILLDGYLGALDDERGAFVLEERHAHLRALADMNRGNAPAFWKKLTAQPETDAIPAEVKDLLLAALPKGHGGRVRLSTRVAGQGSLGRERYVAVACLHGGLVAREAKAAAPSACAWVGDAADATPLYDTILGAAVRCPDPFHALVDGRWIVRRLAPACSRIELDTVKRGPDRRKLVTSMGAEIANVHFGTGRIDEVIADIAARGDKWLTKAATKMEEQVLADWKAWRQHLHGK